MKNMYKSISVRPIIDIMVEVNQSMRVVRGAANNNSYFSLRHKINLIMEPIFLHSVVRLSRR